MTVCIAAICQVGSTPMVVGASDRMLTTGDTEYEPRMQKIGWFGGKIVVLTAGDTAIQRHCYNETVKTLAGSKADVKAIADIYADHFLALRQALAERSVLRPMGLTFVSFLAQQSSMHGDFIRDISTRLRHIQSQIDFETIITGLDQTGTPHVYLIRCDGSVHCYDSVGFATIGFGASHASSEFMTSGYAPYWQYEVVLSLTYAAKKRAEAAPGVGWGTDAFFIEPSKDYPVLLDESTMNALLKIHGTRRQRDFEAQLEAHRSVFDYVEKVRKAQTAPPEQQARAKESELEQGRLQEGAQDSEPARQEE